MIVRRAPGKLFIAGEYAVVESGCPAVIVAVDRYVVVTISTSESLDVVLRSDIDGGSALSCTREAGKLTARNTDATERRRFSYVLSAIAVVERLAIERGLQTMSFTLTVRNELTEADGRKLGLGSSAAVTVATVAAIGELYQLGLSMMDRYRLALLATLAVNPHGSGGDVAASTWGGWIAYTAPDREPLSASAIQHGIQASLRARWDGLTVRALPAPKDLALQVGWTGEPASTPALLARPRQLRHNGFLTNSTDCVRRLVRSLDAQNPDAIKSEIRCARRLLEAFDTASQVGIRTPRLTALCEIAETLGAAAKSSGAGGGDCGIALIDRTADTEIAQLHDCWASAGIRPLRLGIHTNQRLRR